MGARSGGQTAWATQATEQTGFRLDANDSSEDSDSDDVHADAPPLYDNMGARRRARRQAGAMPQGLEKASSSGSSSRRSATSEIGTLESGEDATHQSRRSVRISEAVGSGT